MTAPLVRKQVCRNNIWFHPTVEDDATDDFISKDGQIDNEPLWVPAKITSNDNVLLVGRLVNFFVQIAGV